MKKQTTKDIFFSHLKSKRDCITSSWQLYDEMYAKTGRKTQPSTLMHYAREYVTLFQGSLICLSKTKSMYEFRQGQEYLLRNII